MVSKADLNPDSATCAGVGVFVTGSAQRNCSSELHVSSPARSNSLTLTADCHSTAMKGWAMSTILAPPSRRHGPNAIKPATPRASRTNCQINGPPTADARPGSPYAVCTRWKTARAFLLGKEYRYSPVSPLHLFGRSQDIALQRIRSSINERLHLRLWLTPLRYEEHPVWVGQISRDIGVRFTTQEVNQMANVGEFIGLIARKLG